MSVRMWLDDVRPAPDGWTHVRTCDEAIALLRTGTVDEASLDHDLGHCEACDGCRGVQRDPCPCACHRSGTFLVNWMACEGVWPATKPRVHSANPVGAERMRQTIERYWRAPGESVCPHRVVVARVRCLACSERSAQPMLSRGGKTAAEAARDASDEKGREVSQALADAVNERDAALAALADRDRQLAEARGLLDVLAEAAIGAAMHTFDMPPAIAGRGGISPVVFVDGNAPHAKDCAGCRLDAVIAVHRTRTP